ncbi:hypothetical protein ABZ915_24580 [Streptomyces sp. NPDC046915]|uniref:VMAP-C domain-containing protein n=1 Tax=Streptomyces sp. NPDC046915 TaxID=3155257 RepID=UPI0033CFBFD8
MAELNQVDPADVRAVVVGLENYPGAPEMSLPGAADNALRFARWLRRGDVPKDNITVLLSPLDDAIGSLTATAAEADIRWRRVAKTDDIRDVFVQELRNTPGELLYVYWGGHGVLGKDGGRLLFTPDATAADLRCIGVEELRVHLTGVDLHGFAQQVLFFDACATFVESHQLDHGPAPVPFPGCDRRTVDQFLLHAARDGQAAVHDMAEGTGVFSRMLLDWLEEHAPDPLPGLAALEDAVRTWFDERYAVGAPPQTPTTCRHRSLDGRRDTTTGYARPVNLEARLEVAGAVREQLGSDKGGCLMWAGKVARLCGSSCFADGYSVERFAELLLGTPRAMATLVEELTRKDKREAARELLDLSLALQAPGLLSVQEYADLRSLLARWPALSPATVNAITQEAVPGSSVRADSGEPLATARLMTHVAGLEASPGRRSQAPPYALRVPAVVRFLHYLALCSEPVAADYLLRKALDDWTERVVRRLGIEGALQSVRERAVRWNKTFAVTRTLPRVVVQIYPDEPRKLFTCVVWVDPGTGELSRFTHPDNGSPITPAQAVLLIERAVWSVTADDASPVVEIVLQHDDLFDLRVHTWDGSDGDETLPQAVLAVDHRITLRCAPMASTLWEERRQAALRRRWARRAAGTVVYLDDRHAQAPGQHAYGRLQRDLDAARVVVRTARTTGALLVRAALVLGYPVVIWDVSDSQQVTDTHFASLAPERDLHELPGHLRDHWALNKEDSASHPLQPALLLEDHDRRLPPVLPLTQPSGPEEASYR